MGWLSKVSRSVRNVVNDPVDAIRSVAGQAAGITEDVASGAVTGTNTIVDATKAGLGAITGAIGALTGGLSPSADAAPDLPPPTIPPSMTNPAVQPTLDSAARNAVAAVTSGGRTSTMLTGGMGEDETKLNTSKILLGR